MLAALLLAAQTIAGASLTIQWNMHAAAPVPAPAPAVSRGKLLWVRGDELALRLDDGSVCRFVATPAQSAALRARIGTRIAFKTTP